MSTTESMFTQPHDMTIVAHRHGKSKTVAQKSRKRYDTLPRHIWSILDATSLEVGTWTADADRTYCLVSAICLRQEHYALGKLADKRTDSGILVSWEMVSCNNISPQIHNCICGKFQTYINAYNAFFHFCCVHRTSYFGNYKDKSTVFDNNYQIFDKKNHFFISFLTFLQIRLPFLEIGR